MPDDIFDILSPNLVFGSMQWNYGNHFELSQRLNLKELQRSPFFLD